MSTPRRRRRRRARRSQRTSILAIDTSNSMAGRADRRGQEGRARVPRHRPRPTSRSASSPSTTRPDAGGADARPRCGARRDRRARAHARRPALYDGVHRRPRGSRPRRRRRGQRKILVLSDGKDTTNTPSSSDVLDGGQESEVTVDVVSLAAGRRGQRSRSTRSPARARARVLTAADPAALTAAFAEEAERSRTRSLVTASCPPGRRAPSSNVAGDASRRPMQTFTTAAYLPVRTAEDVAAAKAAPPSRARERRPFAISSEHDATAASAPSASGCSA